MNFIIVIFILIVLSGAVSWFLFEIVKAIKDKQLSAKKQSTTNEKKQFTKQKQFVASNKCAVNRSPLEQKQLRINDTKPNPFAQRQPIESNTKSSSKQRQAITTGEWTVQLLLALEWKRFEEVCHAYLIMTDRNAELTNIGADGGIDIKIKDKAGKTIAIGQCKAWLSKITVKEVREFFGVMASEKVAHGCYFATSTFTEDAIKFCADKNITLLDKHDLIKNIKRLSKEKQVKLYKIATKGDYTTPTCPRCDKKMLKRTGKNGEFWGCANYPTCKNTLQVRKLASVLSTPSYY